MTVVLVFALEGQNFGELHGGLLLDESGGQRAPCLGGMHQISGGIRWTLGNWRFSKPFRVFQSLSMVFSLGLSDSSSLHLSSSVVNFRNPLADLQDGHSARITGLSPSLSLHLAPKEHFANLLPIRNVFDDGWILYH